MPVEGQSYINASIIFQLLTAVIPQLEAISKEGELFEKEIEMVDAGDLGEMSGDNSTPSGVVNPSALNRKNIEVKTIAPSKTEKEVYSLKRPPISVSVKTTSPIISDTTDFDMGLVDRLSTKDEALETDLRKMSDEFEDDAGPSSSEVAAPVPEYANAGNGNLSDKEKGFIKLVMSSGAYPLSEARKLARKDGLMLDAFVEDLNEKGLRLYGFPFVTIGTETIIFNPDIGQIDLDKGGSVWNQQEN